MASRQPPTWPRTVTLIAGLCFLGSLVGMSVANGQADYAVVSAVVLVIALGLGLSVDRWWGR